MASYTDFTLINNVNKPDPKVESLDTTTVQPSHWVTIIFASLNQKTFHNEIAYNDALKLAKTLGTVTDDNFKLIESSTISTKIDYTQQGLAQALFIAWANEHGFALGPDMLLSTVISEVVAAVCDKPNDFKHLFTASQSTGKTVLNLSEGLTIDSLIKHLSQHIPNKQLVDITTNTTFSCAPPHYSQVMGIALANMASPYYEYWSTMCGLPMIRLLGTDEDWLRLHTRLLELADVFSSQVDPESAECWVNPLAFYHLDSLKFMKQYIQRAASTVQDIIKAKADNDAEFFKGIFSYRANPKCGSGHDDVLMDGWIRTFYRSQRNLMSQYPSHINCLPYIDKTSDVPVYKVYVAGLTSSQVEDGILYPEYNIGHFIIDHDEAETLYKILAQ
ncbi:Domain of unknown function (DUF4419)-containing protein [uncultured virus]|nr:Domain of unknown function (DUF4419)-containing protein [uncultured virus]